MATLKTPITPKDHIQGPENAAATLVEYGDYECPYCGRAYPIVKRVQKHFGKGLRFVFRNFPLSEMHPQAESAAETAEFAGAARKVLGDARWFVRKPGAPWPAILFGACPDDEPICRATSAGARRRQVSEASSGRLQHWRAQRSQRHTGFLH